MVEHVAGGKQQDHDDADGSPEVAVLEEGENVGTSDSGSSEEAQDRDSANDQSHPVEGAVKGRCWSVGEIATEPAVDWFGTVCSGRVSTCGLLWSTGTA